MMEKHLQTIAHGLILVAIMLGLIAGALWMRSGSLESSAQAQTRAPDADNGVLDAGKQRVETLNQLKDLNRQLAEIQRGLRDGTFSVQTPDVKTLAKAVEGKAGR
jgi:hypothetical protein